MKGLELDYVITRNFYDLIFDYYLYSKWKANRVWLSMSSWLNLTKMKEQLCESSSQLLFLELIQRNSNNLFRELASFMLSEGCHKWPSDYTLFFLNRLTPRDLIKSASELKSEATTEPAILKVDIGKR